MEYFEITNETTEQDLDNWLEKYFKDASAYEWVFNDYNEKWQYNEKVRYFSIDITDIEENDEVSYQKYYVEIGDKIYVKDGKIYTVDD